MRCFRVVLSLVVGGLLLSGCVARAPGQEGDAAEDRQARADPQPAVQCDPGKEQWRAAGAPRRGGVFKWAGGNLDNLSIIDPGGHPSNAPHVYHTLVKQRACFADDTAVVASLARSWQVSPDGLTWTFKLREDVRWHNKPPLQGRLLTAADVAWTIDYQQQGGGLKSYWQGVAHQEPDQHTVVLTLKAPDADFLGKVVDERNIVVAREVQEQLEGFKTVAVGTGPFMVKEFKPNQIVVYEPNSGFYEMGADGKPLPYIQEAHQLRFGDYTAEVAALRAGLLDTNTASGYRRLDADLIMRSIPKIQSQDYVKPTIFGLHLDVRRKPFDDARVRRALSLAIDRQEVIDGSNQGSAVYSGFVSPALRDYAWPKERSVEKFKPDAEGAKKLLAEAGYGPGQLQFVIKTVGPYAQDAEVVQQHLQRVGINGQLSVEPGSSSLVLLAKGGFDAVWGAYTSPSLVSYSVAEGVRTGGAANYVGFSDPKVDALAEAQGKALNPVQRKQIIDQLQHYLYDTMPYVPVLSRVYHRFTSCRTRNMPPPHFENSYASGLEHAWLDQSGC